MEVTEPRGAAGLTHSAGGLGFGFLSYLFYVS